MKEVWSGKKSYDRDQNSVEDEGLEIMRSGLKPAAQDGNAGLFTQDIVAGLQPEKLFGYIDFIYDASFGKAALKRLQMDRGNDPVVATVPIFSGYQGAYDKHPGKRRPFDLAVIFGNRP